MQSISDVKWMLLQWGGEMNSPRRLPYCISYRKSRHLSKQNAAGLMDENRRRDSRPFQRHLDVCAPPGQLHVASTGLVSTHIAKWRATDRICCEQMWRYETWGWTRICLLFYLMFLPGLSVFISTQLDTHTHTLLLQPRPVWCWESLTVT